RRSSDLTGPLYRLTGSRLTRPWRGATVSLFETGEKDDHRYGFPPARELLPRRDVQAGGAVRRAHAETGRGRASAAAEVRVAAHARAIRQPRLQPQLHVRPDRGLAGRRGRRAPGHRLGHGGASRGELTREPR